MKLIVITDINNRPYPEECISSKLTNFKDIVRVALNELCGQPNLEGEELHRFLSENDGFNLAIDNLTQLASGDCVGLGYSAGGTAIWRAVRCGMELHAVYCVSSTRLRNELSISIPNHVFFGENDPNRPSDDWLSKVPLEATVFDKLDHNFYTELSSQAKLEICAKILKDFNKQTFS